MTKRRFSVEELLSTDFPDEPAEEAYRRGYSDGMEVAIDYLTSGIDADWLARWRLAVLNKWAKTDTEQEIEPPLADLWVETPDGFQPIPDQEAPNV